MQAARDERLKREMIGSRLQRSMFDASGALCVRLLRRCKRRASPKIDRDIGKRSYSKRLMTFVYFVSNDRARARASACNVRTSEQKKCRKALRQMDRSTHQRARAQLNLIAKKKSTNRRETRCSLVVDFTRSIVRYVFAVDRHLRTVYGRRLCRARVRSISGLSLLRSSRTGRLWRRLKSREPLASLHKFQLRPRLIEFKSTIVFVDNWQFSYFLFVHKKQIFLPCSKF